MAMTVDSRHQTQLGGLPYDGLRYQPQFTNPWVSGASNPSQLYPSSSLAPLHSGLDAARASSAMSYQSIPVTAPSLSASGIGLPDSMYGQQSSLAASQDLINNSRTFGAEYATSASPAQSTYAPTSAPQYAMDYSRGASSYAYDNSRRSSHPSVPSLDFLGHSLEAQRPRQNSLVDFSRLNGNTTQAQRSSFSDALDASRGMVAMSQDITPRNIYGGNPRSSTDSYGFPSTHSQHSSISSSSGYPYYTGSVGDSSVTDYSSASESLDIPSRTLPRPTGLVAGGMPPAPQSMMGQFSSKVSTSSQKKHKCKICEKRFTRPSSLQTHMYSHTGEKPFACEVEGCGRHFSVVSNLRRHRKVHKNDRDHPSPDDE